MRLAGLILLFLALCPMASAKVWQVAPTGGDFTSINTALNVAVDGDVILVAKGVYIEFVEVNAKSVTLAAEVPGTHVYVNSLAVTGLGAGQRVVVRGIDFVNAFAAFTFAKGVSVSGCAGTVWLEDCALEGNTGHLIFGYPQPGEAALKVQTSNAVTAVRCSFEGGAGYSANPSPAGDGILVESGSLALWDCSVQGGVDGSQPGDGLRITAGELMVSGSAISGGSATANGLVVTSAAASVSVLDSTFSSVVAPPGTILNWPAKARSLELLTPVKEDATVTARLHGVPGDSVFLIAGLTGAHAQIAGTQGWHLLGTAIGPFFLQTINDPSGIEWLYVLAPGNVPPSVEGATWLLQPYFLNPWEAIAGAPSSLVLLK